MSWLETKLQIFWIHFFHGLWWGLGIAVPLWLLDIKIVLGIL